MKPNSKMKFIGITGGVGAGKSEILSYLAKKKNVRVMLADEIAHQLMEPGSSCYRKAAAVFAKEDVFLPGGAFDKAALSRVIFSSDEKRKRLNEIVHPAVKEYVMDEVRREREKGELSMLVLEAALLIEEHYDEICDELWYISTGEEIRKERLMASRGYSEEKVRQILASQLPESEYRKHAGAVIDNNGTIEQSIAQTENLIRSKQLGDSHE